MVKITPFEIFVYIFCLLEPGAKPVKPTGPVKPRPPRMCYPF